MKIKIESAGPPPPTKESVDSSSSSLANKTDTLSLQKESSSHK